MNDAPWTHAPGRRETIRGIVEAGGVGMLRGRRPDGRWDSWRMAVRLRPTCRADGQVSADALYLWTPTRLPRFLWALLFPPGAARKVWIERDVGSAGRARLLAWRGPAPGDDLRNAKAAWLEGRQLDDPRFHRFRYDAQLDWFEADVEWLGQTVTLTLTVSGQDHQPALDTAHRLFDDAEAWRDRVEAAIVATLLPLKNENWLDAGEVALTPDAFLARLRLKSITASDQSATFWYDDGGMFGGHSVETWVDLETNEMFAQISG